MPIGIELGDLGGGRGEVRPARPRLPLSSRPSAPTVPPEPPDRRDRIAVTGTRPALVITIWSRWVTAADERTCPVCAPLHGTVWPDGDGPSPPLHGNCRCARVLAYVEVASR